MSEQNEDMQTISGEVCPMCNKKTLTLMEAKRDIPYFGICYIFSMSCSSCHYHKGDLEAEEERDPVTITFTIENEEDLSTRFIKSAAATVKIPHIMTIEPGEASNGYISNIEGLLERVRKRIENVRDNADDPSERKKAKNMIKKLQNVLWGHDALKITVSDPSGNSAIISDKAEIKPLKVKKK